MARSTTVRGLAVSVVAALAATGLAGLVPPGAAAAGPGVVLISQFNPGADASTRFDGWDTLITLAAVRLDPGATVSFEYNLNPDATDAAAGWSPIAGSPTFPGDGAYATLAWDGENASGVSLAGQLIAVRAVATVDPGGGPTSTYSRRNRVRVAGAGASTQTVHFNDAGGLATYFVQPYTSSGRTATLARVDGLTSATGGTVAVSWRDDDGTLRGTTNAPVTPTSLVPPTGPLIPGGSFAGVVDLSAADPVDGEVMAFAAHRDTDDVAARQLAQLFLDDILVPQPDPAPAGTTAPVTVYIFNSGYPVVGAEVRRDSDNASVGYTDVSGRVIAQQAAGAPAVRYYANATDDDLYSADEGDIISDPVTVGSYVPTPTSTSPRFADGTVFDDDEYTAGDLSLQLTDQHGRDLATAGQQVGYRIYPAGATPPATLQVATTNANGRAPLAFDRGLPSGDLLLDYRLGGETDSGLGIPLSTAPFTAGDAVLSLAPNPNPAVAPIGGQVDYVATLAIGDSPLPARAVSLQFVRGVEVVPGRTADAGIVAPAGLVVRRTVTTDGDGRFEVTVDDPHESVRASEVGGRLVARSVAASATSPVRFGNGARGTVRIRLAGTGNGAGADTLRLAAPPSVGRETVRVYRVVDRRLVLERTVRLNPDGDVPALRVSDRNGTARTTYVARLVASRRVLGAMSNRLALA